MTEDEDGPVWFGEEASVLESTDTAPESGTDQTWFNDLAFEPTAAGRPPDADRNFETETYGTLNDGEDGAGTDDPDGDGADEAALGLAVTSSVQTDTTGAPSTNGDRATSEADAASGDDDADPEQVTAAPDAVSEADDDTETEQAAASDDTVPETDGPAAVTGDDGAKVDAGTQNQAVEAGGSSEENDDDDDDDGGGLLAWLKSLFT